MSKRPKNRRHNTSDAQTSNTGSRTTTNSATGNTTADTANNKSNNKILDRLGNKALELANKLLPDKWRTPNPQTKCQESKSKPKYRKQKIPIALRQACWVKQFGETYKHKCFVDWCHRKITCFDFEVGHNLPESKGGTLNLDNLRPICRQCNIGMGNTYTIDQWRMLKIKV